jgi:SAM-dependent methyltransferase
VAVIRSPVGEPTMIDSLKPFSAAPLPCKICGGVAELYGVVDFHKSCAEAQGIRLRLSGVPIYYRRCATCDFLFTEAFDNWSHDQFKAHIYNESYQTVDPDYQTKRPSENARVVARLWSAYKGETRVLDYGGGNDVFCTVLRASGFPLAVTYDPMTPEYAHRPDGKFDLVTCFETLEHLPDPAAGIASILEYAADPGGLILFTTFAQPSDFNNYGLHWWYVGPRNGHVSIFSKQALTRAFARHGYRLVSFNDNAHLAFRTLPPFLAHLDTSAPNQQNK